MGRQVLHVPVFPRLPVEEVPQRSRASGAIVFKAVLDSKDIEAIKAEQKTLKEDYEQHLNKHKETLNQLRESEKSTLSNHRDELKEIMRGESVWLSFKAWMWGIVLVIGFLAVAFGLGFFYAKANYP